MISLRYHIVSIAAAFLALAVGVVLGSTALNGALLSGLSDEKSELARRVTDLEAERNALSARLSDADAFAGSVGGKVVSGILDKRSVVLVTTESARPADRDAIKDLIGESGASVTGEVQLTSSFADPRNADQLREVVTRLQPAGAQFPTAGDPGTLAGALLGSVLLLDKDTAKRQSSPEELAAALSGLADGGFVKPPEDVAPAQLAVVLTGGDETGDGAGDRAATLARFATQLDRSGAGTVLAGNPASADGTGPLGFARADTASTSILSTVDNVNTSAGRVATVLALREQLEGGSGRYGVAGNAEGPAPGVRQDHG
ncbi:copper transport outer membrane protein MctB [Prauserella shujinwangii]|uniref:Copper transport outer membrane protein MctB n=1 Tax=Prauserella shujinwangii TaxID=1453103 RepID=A0A2T0LRU3_9PSEU|nr:copper transporter [Prauserella shujinwangii]PRX46216.1 copper transport outer membrane protein MctB [Prauserella shujinwangii]